jgi:hypothetical protein
LTLDEKKVFWNFCLDYRLSPCSFYGHDPDPAPSELAELKDRGLNVVCLQKVRQRVLSDKDKAQLASELKKWRDGLLKLGMERDAVVLLADEPKPETEDFCRTNAQWLKEQYSELKLWVATRPKAPWDEFSDIFDTITIHSTDFYAPHSHDESALRHWLQVHPSGEYWWFHSVEPYAPYTNLRLDNLPIEARVAGWQNAQYAVDGYEYFGIDDWSENVDSSSVPWPKRAEQWKTGLSGAGTLCYPDQKMRPMPSLRLVNLRDGIQDWALLEMLNPRHTRMKQAPMLESVSKDLAHYTTDPKTLLEARHALIQALLQKPK